MMTEHRLLITKLALNIKNKETETMMFPKDCVAVKATNYGVEGYYLG